LLLHQQPLLRAQTLYLLQARQAPLSPCAGPAPIFFSFGSAVASNPDKLTQVIVQAVQALGLRAIIQKGWAGLGAKLSPVPPNILIIDSIPHDWLFHRRVVRACEQSLRFRCLLWLLRQRAAPSGR
jgi:UDP:flavonoid glycosyltransferase YjiC (YdhE family)